MLIFRAASIQVRRLPDAGEDDQDGDERRPAVFQVGPSPRGRQRTRLPHGQLLGSQRAGVEKRERNPGTVVRFVSLGFGRARCSSVVGVFGLSVERDVAPW